LRRTHLKKDFVSRSAIARAAEIFAARSRNVVSIARADTRCARRDVDEIGFAAS
jgi:hypothetical protein